MCSNVAEFTSVRMNELTKAHGEDDSGWKIEVEESFSQRKIKQPMADLADQQNWSGDCGGEEGEPRNGNSVKLSGKVASSLSFCLP